MRSERGENQMVWLLVKLITDSPSPLMCDRLSNRGRRQEVGEKIKEKMWKRSKKRR